MFELRLSNNATFVCACDVSCYNTYHAVYLRIGDHSLCYIS